MSNVLQTLVLKGTARQASKKGDLLAVVLMAACFAAVTLLGRTLHERPEPRIVSVKREIAADPATGIYFLGNSHVYRHIDPVVIDRELSALGIESRSVNLGLPAMTVGEALYWVDALPRPSESHPPPVLVLELSMLPMVAVRNMKSERFRYWHGASETVTMIRYSLTAESLGPREGVKRASLHLEALGDLWLARSQLLPEHDDDDASIPFAVLREHRGFLPLEASQSENIAERRKRFASRPKAIRKRLGQLRRGVGPKARYRAQAQRELLSPFVARVRRRGYELVFLVGPGFRKKTWLYGGGAQLLGMPVLAFNDAERYPELFTRQSWFDRGHLTQHGAELYSKLLARRLAPLIRSRDALH